MKVRYDACNRFFFRFTLSENNTEKELRNFTLTLAENLNSDKEHMFWCTKIGEESHDCEVSLPVLLEKDDKRYYSLMIVHYLRPEEVRDVLNLLSTSPKFLYVREVVFKNLEPPTT